MFFFQSSNTRRWEEKWYFQFRHIVRFSLITQISRKCCLSIAETSTYGFGLMSSLICRMARELGPFRVSPDLAHLRETIVQLLKKSMEPQCMAHGSGTVLVEEEAQPPAVLAMPPQPRKEF